MINFDSGFIVFDDSLSIDKLSSLYKLENIPSAKSAPSIAGRTQLSLGSHPSQGKNWGVGVTFVDSKLNQVGLMCLNVKGIDDTAWSLESEKMRKMAHDSLLVEWCSKGVLLEHDISSLKYKFPWGKVSSVLDIRGVQALILVEYEQAW